MSDSYEIYAIKYADLERPVRDHFLFGDPHDGNMFTDYFLWAIVGEDRTVIVDTGFDPAMGKKRGRNMVHPPAEGLKALGIDHETIADVIITHMHYDHAGNHDLFPRATFHVQDREMAYCTGRCMCHTTLNMPFEAEDVAAMIRRLFEGRLKFHGGDSEVAPGITVHHVGGHTDGLQIVRVRTARGWVVLASDATHLYANIEQNRPVPLVYNVGDMLEGFKRIRELAGSPDHIIPGHDPQVLARYPAPVAALDGWIAKLDAPPK